MKAPTHIRNAHQADSVTSQNTWIFSNADVRMSHLMKCLTVFLGYVEVFERFRICFDFLILLPAVEITTWSKCETRNLHQYLFKMWHLFLVVWSIWFCYFIILLTDHPTADHIILFCDEVISVMLYLECTEIDTCLKHSVLTYISDMITTLL